MPIDSNLHRFLHKKESAADFLAQRVEELWRELRPAEPQNLAQNTGSLYEPTDDGPGQFRLPLWGREVALTYPDFAGRDVQTGRTLDTFALAQLAYYFSTADGAPPSGKWIAFSELPDGKFYAHAFQGYTGNELAKAFGDDKARFTQAAERLKGWPMPFADLAFRFQVLPHVALMVACWLGDEDFPSSYRLLFDAAVSHHLPIDACAVVGGQLTRRLINASHDN